MRRLFFALYSLSLLLVSCSDGDILTIDLAFDEVLSLCGDENSANYVIYDTKSDPNESLTLLFPVNTTNNLIFKPETSPHEGSFGISSAVKFNYRTYDGDPLLLICQEIPSSTVKIIKDYVASSGTVNYISTFEDVDGMRTVTVAFTITTTDLGILNTDEIKLGTYTSDPFEL